MLEVCLPVVPRFSSSVAARGRSKSSLQSAQVDWFWCDPRFDVCRSYLRFTFLRVYDFSERHSPGHFQVSSSHSARRLSPQQLLLCSFAVLFRAVAPSRLLHASGLRDFDLQLKILLHAASLSPVHPDAFQLRLNLASEACEQDSFRERRQEVTARRRLFLGGATTTRGNSHGEELSKRFSCTLSCKRRRRGSKAEEVGVSTAWRKKRFHGECAET
ncbi:hypothetical protein TGGT1_206520 [Toxoplasma gondii GT1]|uniref:Uncharacterized protein n=3 Tax=Toxoplasma gondii TaxID=5811 RepID=S7W9K9_TOXGG|nr:hypothetical protein TGGT1_206520 [Toxoplasma gondii GT1]KAF4642624.1 hypothetical protein TGRH88_033490 [Toxoplasma gondii]KFG38242.1 hypothetical protein TGFOU_206520 [Toxoplasma gondii FOU]